MEIPLPTKGTPLEAAWAQRVTRVCNAMGLGSADLLISEDQTGRYLAAKPINLRNRTAASGETPGCFDLVFKPAEETKKSGTYFENRYLMLGDVLVEIDKFSPLEDLLSTVELPNATPTGIFVALRHPAVPDGEQASSIVLAKSIAELCDKQADTLWHTIPIYLLEVTKTEEESESDEVTIRYTWQLKCDFRRGLFAQQYEVLGGEGDK